MDEISARLARLAEAERQSKAMHRDDVVTRNEAIAAADQAGTPLVAIARACGLGVSTISQIVAEQTAQRQRAAARSIIGPTGPL